MTKRENGRSQIFFHSITQKAAPSGQIYPPPSARPFFKGLHNSHVKMLTLRKVSSPISSFQAKREIFVILEGLTLSPHVPRCSAFLICLSYRQCPIRPFGAPSPRGEGFVSGIVTLSQMVHLRRFPTLFHTASTLSGSLRSPPSQRGEGFAWGIVFPHMHVFALTIWR